MTEPTRTHTAAPADRTLLRSLLLATLLMWSALLFTLSAAPAALGGDPPATPRGTAVSGGGGGGEDAYLEAFVSAVSEYAVLEQSRAGIPASVTAAQAILESSWGRNPIAVAGNNYFGIKCKSYWTGEVVFHEDDDRDAATGELVESCFRAYACVEDSFRDHSEFLLATERYRVLFALSPTDYKGWAHGLSACGYATDPAYAEKLIGIIERLDLYALDWPADDVAAGLMSVTE